MRCLEAVSDARITNVTPLRAFSQFPRLHNNARFHSAALYAKTARILICMAIFGELVFIFVADYMKNGTSTLHIYFVFSYILMAVLQVSIFVRDYERGIEKVKGSERLEKNRRFLFRRSCCCSTWRT